MLLCYPSQQYWRGRVGSRTMHWLVWVGFSRVSCQEVLVADGAMLNGVNAWPCGLVRAGFARYGLRALTDLGG